MVAISFIYLFLIFLFNFLLFHKVVHTNSLWKSSNGDYRMEYLMRIFGES